MQNSRYPAINILSKNHLAKHISSKKLSYKSALELINDVKLNFNKYWIDHPTMSQPKKQKWVRDASRSNLGKLLKQIDLKVLKPHDHMLPDFIYGGVNGLDHKAAVKALLGRRRKRILLKIDITRFYEQIKEDRVFSLFFNQFKCSKLASRLVAALVCVPHGPKLTPDNYKTIARGFSTSSRLSVWCNLDTFLKIERLVRNELKGKDPRIAIYVDDIGITASNVTVDEMVEIYKKLSEILISDNYQKLPLNENKTKIVLHSGKTYDSSGNFLGRWSFEHLGSQMNRNSLTPGTKTRWKIADLSGKLKLSKGRDKTIKRKRKSLLGYKEYIKRN